MTRAGNLVAKERLRLPELDPLTELASPSCWFPVPGMYGGFSRSHCDGTRHRGEGRGSAFADADGGRTGGSSPGLVGGALLLDRRVFVF